MKTTILLPLILIPSFLSTSQAAEIAVSSDAPEMADILRGCRRPVMDTRLASRILYETRLDEVDGIYGQDARDKRGDTLFIARCGEEFVLFNSAFEGQNAFGNVHYMRFESGTFALVEESWG